MKRSEIVLIVFEPQFVHRLIGRTLVTSAHILYRIVSVTIPSTYYPSSEALETCKRLAVTSSSKPLYGIRSLAEQAVILPADCSDAQDGSLHDQMGHIG